MRSLFRVILLQAFVLLVCSAATVGHAVEIPALPATPVIEVADAIPTMDVGLSWHNAHQHSVAAKAFMESLHLGMGSGQPHSFIGNEGRVRL